MHCLRLDRRIGTEARDRPPGCTWQRRSLGRLHLWTPVHRIESNVRYLGIEVDDALEISEQTEI